MDKTFIKTWICCGFIALLIVSVFLASCTSKPIDYQEECMRVLKIKEQEAIIESYRGTGEYYWDKAELSGQLYGCESYLRLKSE